VRYPKEVVLKDGKEAVIRLLVTDDEELLRKFYDELPEEDRWYMRFDVMDPSVIKRWIDKMAEGTIFSIIAITAGEIVAHARLHMLTYGCYSHMGRLRIIVRQEFRNQRLGTWMLLDLIQLAMEKGLRELRSDFVIGIEDVAIDTAYKLDFFKRAILEKVVRDPQGNSYDLQVMTKRLHKDWGDF